jgi:hypothetical protein
MMAWNPIEQPYRVSWTTAAPYPANWRTSVQTFATLEEAEAAFTAPSKLRGLKSVHLDKAVNPETWQSNGSWKKLLSRKPLRRRALATV